MYINNLRDITIYYPCPNCHNCIIITRRHIGKFPYSANFMDKVIETDKLVYYDICKDLNQQLITCEHCHNYYKISIKPTLQMATIDLYKDDETSDKEKLELYEELSKTNDINKNIIIKLENKIKELEDLLKSTIG